MGLRVYNTLTRQKEPLETVQPGRVGMYVCGPTVYKPSHLGHMVGPVIFDTIKRYLAYLGYQVTLVINITDVDDKLIVQAHKQKTTVPELAERVTADYRNNLQRLGVTGIDLMPRATEHIADILRMIQGLIDKGFAYPAGGDVYFDVTRDPDYGKLCHRDPEQLEAGARIEISDRKRNPGDFALWKGAKPGEPHWDSPWGPGRPGWHIECSAMSMRYLGQTLDIHGGGLDLQFPHHENELAQSESYTGRPFVRYWMHNGLMKTKLETGYEKMSKSKGNEIVVTELLQRHHPETLRFFLLATHYRRPIDFSEERLEEVRRGLESFYRFFERCQRITGSSFHDLSAPATRAAFRPEDFPGSPWMQEVLRHRDAFLECMDDDFNTGGAIGILYELLTTLNRFADARQLESGPRDEATVGEFQRGGMVLKELSQVLGLFRELVARPVEGNSQLRDQLAQLLAELKVDAGEATGVEEIMRVLIDARAGARKARNFALADQIRQRLGQLGVTLEDRPGGTGWRVG
ncbi:MAG: cysteine--tRNA ligase [Planctomycetes bacterium]|nr:cysteine--tRNA ligase [Planctomycetota bacterium]